MIVTSVNNLTNKSKYISIALLLKKLRVASQSFLTNIKQSALKLLKVRTVTDLIVA